MAAEASTPAPAAAPLPRTGTQPPSRAVLDAFGAGERPQRLAGGRGLTWRSGGVVLRPAGELREATWKSEVLDGLATNDEFTVPRPILVAGDLCGGDRWVCEGWQALEWVAGAADETRVDDIVRAGLAFQRAVAGVPRPEFIAASDDNWSVADRLAWGDDAVWPAAVPALLPAAPAVHGGLPAGLPDDPLLAALLAEYRPVATPAQVIHGDLLGNVLFAPGRPPAVIDWAPYWRPPGTAAAIAVADAACWHGLPLASLADDRRIPEWRQLLLRSLVFRLATEHLNGRWTPALAARQEPVVAAVLGLVAG